MWACLIGVGVECGSAFCTCGVVGGLSEVYVCGMGVVWIGMGVGHVCAVGVQWL